MAKHGRWVLSMGVGWLWAAINGRWVAKLVVRLRASTALWVRIQTSLKISNTVVDCTLHFSVFLFFFFQMQASLYWQHCLDVGVIDFGEKCIGGVVDTGKQNIAGVNDTDDKF